MSRSIRRNIQRKSEINRIRQHLLNVFPHARKVDVKINKEPKKGFVSSIKVLVPKRKALIAKKGDTDLRKSLEKSRLAIVRQIHKTKTKYKKIGSRSHTEMIVA